MKKFNLITVALAIVLLSFIACGSDGTSTKKYTVTFDADNGSPVFTQAVLDGGWAHQPQDPTKTIAAVTVPGLYLAEPPIYTFVEWQLNGTAFNFDTPITANVKLTANYSGPTIINTVAANDISAAVDYVRTNAAVGEYILLLNQNVNADAQKLDTANMKLTIIGIGEPRTITFNGEGDDRAEPLFNLQLASTSLTLGNNITLMGISNGLVELVRVFSANLIMLDGSKITGHAATMGTAVAISGVNAHFTMHGGEITGNHYGGSSTTTPGGLRVYSANTFTMTGGSITGNTHGDPPVARDVVLSDDAIANSSKTGGTIGVSIPPEFAN